jgi:hypothetical protein
MTMVGGPATGLPDGDAIAVEADGVDDAAADGEGAWLEVGAVLLAHPDTTRTNVAKSPAGPRSLNDTSNSFEVDDLGGRSVELESCYGST